MSLTRDQSDRPVAGSLYDGTEGCLLLMPKRGVGTVGADKNSHFEATCRQSGEVLCLYGFFILGSHNMPLLCISMHPPVKIVASPSQLPRKTNPSP